MGRCAHDGRFREPEYTARLPLSLSSTVVLSLAIWSRPQGSNVRVASREVRCRNSAKAVTHPLDAGTGLRLVTWKN